MSKERLEEIKEHFRWTLNNSLVPRLHDSEIEWLIEQAERVEELKKFKRSAEQLYKNYHLSAKRSVAEKEELREQNKRYREALEEILAESYEEAGLHPDTNMQLETFIAKTARKALEGESDA